MNAYIVLTVLAIMYDYIYEHIQQNTYIQTDRQTDIYTSEIEV